MKTTTFQHENRCVSFKTCLTGALSALAAFCLAAHPAISQGGTIEGIVFSESGPVSEATVFVYRNYEDLASGREFSKSLPGDRKGHYKLQLPVGNYYLIARATQEGRPLFSYHGVNPISVSEDYRWLPFLLVEENETTCRESPGQSITGRVTYKKQPVQGGVVSIYPWHDGKFRGMGLLTNTLDENGEFSFVLEPGTYVVVARKKQDIKGIGPVKRGDMFCYPSTNPVTVATGQTCAMDINCYPRDDLELFLNVEASNPQGRRHESRRQASLHDLQPADVPPLPHEVPASISGQVTDPAGKPRPGLIVTAYPAQGVELFQMHVVRLITDNMGQTDGEGRYRIDLKDGKEKYYIVAREKVGEAPGRSEYYGLYEGSYNHAVSVEHGDNLTGINLVVDRIMPLPSTAPQP